MEKHLEYNTQREKLPMPEYGRSIQNMVDYALTIEDRAERQRCANTIINIMGNMFPHLRDVPEFNHKLWDHLAIMSGFQLDIDYPYEINAQDHLSVKPARLHYPVGRIRYRHYGRFIQTLVKKLAEMPDDERKKQLIKLVAMQMKKNYVAWNKEGVEDQKILDDIAEYTNNAVRLDSATFSIGATGSNGGSGNGGRNYAQRNKRPQNNKRKQY
jgi:hypothetical protein